MSKFLDSLVGRKLISIDNEEIDKLVESSPDNKVYTCKICGKKFYSANRKFYCPRQHFANCVICGKFFELNPKYYGFCEISHTCSDECNKKYNAQRVKESFREKYGVDNAMDIPEFRNKISVAYHSKSEEEKQEIKERTAATVAERYGSFANPEIVEKRKRTSLERYGVENPMQCREIQKKAEATNLERYGYKHTFSCPEIRAKGDATQIEKYGCLASNSQEIKEKRKATCIAKYGVPYVLQSDVVKEKIAQTNLVRFGVENPSQNEEIIEKRRQTNIDKYGVPAAFMLPESMEKSRESMIKLKNSSHISKINISVSELLTESGIYNEYEFPLCGHWFDLIIPDQKILIEIDPTYSHSKQPNFFYKDGMDRYYHINKTKLAEKNGYRCIHIFDWDDLSKIVKLLLPKIKVYARNCKVVYIESEIADEFLEDNHLQGTCGGQSVCLGLLSDNDELLEVVTFGKPRYSKKYQWELLRLCSAPEIQVVGGASKLFRTFVTDFQPKSIISYCNRAKFSGNVYQLLGFKHIRTNAPGEVWSKKNDYITDSLLRQRGFDQLFGTNYGKGTSNEELIMEAGWKSVYDCGQAVYAWASEN